MVLVQGLPRQSLKMDQELLDLTFLLRSQILHFRRRFDLMTSVFRALSKSCFLDPPDSDSHSVEACLLDVRSIVSKSAGCYAF